MSVNETLQMYFSIYQVDDSAQYVCMHVATYVCVLANSSIAECE